jgi:hypothetical protein
MIRYKIAPDVTHLGILKEDGSTQNVWFDHNKHVYFVDILENDEAYLKKIRIYMPDGNDIVGGQSCDWITLHHVGNVYDGRFNRIG